jgi:hypothetical protein
MNINQNAVQSVTQRTAASEYPQGGHFQTTAASAPAAKIYPLSTSEFAALNHVKDQTVRKRLCQTQSYFGVRPLRLAS